ncbi:ABC transporter ATP-binding protein [Inquilinus sp. YAF38]|uniref:ABC transporter ATP-binding protein n=1 Tax=Inquilinus sp. YAF38 TaxID=3233084 RepID=UPI003F92EA71
MIDLHDISKSFAGKDIGTVHALKSLDLSIGGTEFFTLLGPSGCGKTTLLRLIGGFEAPSTGTIRIDGADVAALPPQQRPVNTVFQSYALFPHMTIGDNVAFGLRMLGRPEAEIASRVAAALEMVRLAAMPGAGRRSCPAASSSAWRSPALWHRNRACCCWTSHCRRWT